MKIATKKLSIITLIAGLIFALILITGCGDKAATTTSPSGAPKAGAPAKLAFITQPGGAKAGAALSTQPVIAIQDANGNTVTNSRLPVILTITSSKGESGAAIIGPTTLNAVNGVAKFNNLSMEKAGADYTLTATSGNLETAISAAFSISPGTAEKLAFSVQPSNGSAGSPLPAQPEVIVQDHYGNMATDYQGSVTIGITGGFGRPGSVISGNTSVRVVNSVAKFTDLSISGAYPQCKLTASGDSLEPVTSQIFTISAGAPVKLEFTVQPSGAKAGKPFDEQPKVAIEDAFGNVVISSRASITVSITQDTGTAGATLSGTRTLVAEGGMGGLAEWEDLAINRSGSGYKLTATSGTLTAAVSQAFDVAQ